MPGPDPSHIQPPVPGVNPWQFQISGTLPPEMWNRFGTKILPKLRIGSDLQVGIEFSVTVGSAVAGGFEGEIKRILEDLGLSGMVYIDAKSK